MDEDRLCTACRASLAGPFQPRITLTQPAAGGEDKEVKIVARSWICPGCGLVHWYARDEDLDSLLEAALEIEEAGKVGELEPGSSYERRSKMVRMLRRVRRM